MPKELIFVFKSKDMQRLIDTGARKIIIRSSVVEGILQDGRKAGVLKVVATAKTSKGEGEEVIDGCPEPPCNTDDE